MPLDLKTYERIQRLYLCLLPGNALDPRVIYFDFDEPKREVKGGVHHGRLPIRESKQGDEDVAWGLYDICLHHLEDNRDKWEYI